MSTTTTITTTNDNKQILLLNIINIKYIRIKIFKYVNLIHRQLAPFIRKYKWADLEEITDIKLLGQFNAFSLIYARLRDMDEQFNKYDWSDLNKRYYSRPDHLYKLTSHSILSKRKLEYKFMSQRTILDLMEISVKKNNIQLMQYIKDTYNFGESYYGDRYYVHDLTNMLSTNDSADILAYLLDNNIYTIFDLDSNIEMFMDKGAIKIINLCKQRYSHMLAKKPIQNLAKTGNIEFFKSLKMTKTLRERSITIAASHGQLDLLKYLFDETGFDDEEMELSTLKRILAELMSTIHYSTFKYLVERYNVDLREIKFKYLSSYTTNSNTVQMMDFIRDRIDEFNRAEGKTVTSHSHPVYPKMPLTPVDQENLEIKMMISRTTDLDLFIYYYELYGESIKIQLGLCDYPLEIIRYIYENTPFRIGKTSPFQMINRGWEVMEYFIKIHPEFRNHNYMYYSFTSNDLPIFKKLFEMNYHQGKRLNKVISFRIANSLETIKYIYQIDNSEYSSTEIMRNAAYWGNLSIIMYLLENNSKGINYEGSFRKVKIKQRSPDIIYFINNYIGLKTEEDDDDDEDDDDKEEVKEETSEITPKRVRSTSRKAVVNNKLVGTKTKKDQISESSRLKRLKQ